MDHYTLNLTHNCQNDCLFCFFKYPTVKELPFNSINYKKFLKDVEVKNSVISLGGGEPTLHKELINIIKQFKARNNYVEIITNGRELADRDKLKKIILAGTDRFCVSLHSINKDTHALLTKSNGFSSTLTGILNLIKLRKYFNYDLNVVFVLNIHNLATFKKTLLFLDRLGEMSMQVSLVHTNKPELLIDLSKIAHIFKTIDLNKIKNLKINLYGFAHCFLPKQWARFIVDYKNDDTIVEYKNKRYNHNQLLKLAKSKMPICKQCKYDNKCYGVWNSYFTHHRTDFLKPVK